MPQQPKVIAHLFSSLNGVAEDPHLFQFDSFGQAEGELMAKSLDGVTDVVLGRKLWQEWKEYWKTSDDPFGEFINPVRKHVISTTISGPIDEWNSTLVDGDPAAYVRSLARTAAGKISVAGGVQTVRSLFVAGAIDVLSLTTHPVVTPDGARLFDESVPLTRLELVDSAITPLGNAVLSYSLRRDA